MRRWVAVAMTIGMLILASAACGGGDDGDDGYSEGVRSGYLEGCLKGGNQAFCDCTLQEFEATYSEAEFQELALGFTDSSDPPDEFLEVISACVAELDAGG